MDKVLMEGNAAFGEGAVRAGCRFFFGYPITPQSELPHYLARRMPEVGGVYLQAESEVAAINMVYGAAAAGARVMTASSSPGISLMQEGISYIAGAELPAVIVNIMRGGPGLGNIAPSQSDYFQVVKGGGHGDYRLLVLAPSSVQEIIDLMAVAFELADKYRNPTMVVGDGVLGQMMEPVELGPMPDLVLPAKAWATTGTAGRNTRNIVNSLYIQPEELEKVNLRLQAKYSQMAKEEKRWEEYRLDDAALVLLAFGMVARIAKAAVDKLRAAGIPAGLIRPITLYPFPDIPVTQAAERAKAFLVVEMNAGQMVEDVRLALCGQRPVHFYGRTGGVLTSVAEVTGAAKEIWEVIE
ncbi:MAG TPA: 3-methyl-2-oxobutanoate dehydrogenase subunit VorB [Desulfotomaculum sp.]|nr:3-methyl-2-oxobutanoate dehydrogenase subunit VorB [Desulfotomaculum sp.]